MCDRPKYVFPMVSHILGVSKFKSLSDLRVGYLVVVPKVIREFLVYLGV